MSLQTGRSQNSYTFDASTQLKDAGAITASAAAQVGGAARILDFGVLAAGTSVVQVAYVPGDLVVDVSAIDGVTGDEAYQIHFQLSQSATFASGIFNRATLQMGDMTGSTAEDEYGTGRVVLGVDNEHKGVLYRYGRIYMQIAGTTPSINFVAYLARLR